MAADHDGFSTCCADCYAEKIVRITFIDGPPRFVRFVKYNAEFFQVYHSCRACGRATWGVAFWKRLDPLETLSAGDLEAE